MYLRNIDVDANKYRKNIQQIKRQDSLFVNEVV